MLRCHSSLPNLWPDIHGLDPCVLLASLASASRPTLGTCPPRGNADISSLPRALCFAGLPVTASRVSVCERGEKHSVATQYSCSFTFKQAAHNSIVA